MNLLAPAKNIKYIQFTLIFVVISFHYDILKRCFYFIGKSIHYKSFFGLNHAGRSFKTVSEFSES